MATIAVSVDGNHIFLALENGSGFQVIAKAARSDLATWTAAYAPGAGTAGNVVAVPGNADKMLFYGNFGSGVQVVSHVISTGVETNISPAGLTTKVVNCLAVNPSDSDEVWITINTDQDLKRTIDGGTNWTALDAALGIDPTALAVIFSGAYVPDRAFIAGNDATDELLLYTPNEGSSKTDLVGTTLVNVADICSIEVSE